MKITNGFTQGKMNKDLDERLLPKGQYRDALNIEVNNSNGAGVGALENIKGNTNISNYSFPAEETPVVIGAIADESTNNIYWLVSGSLFDYVLNYNSSTGQTNAVLKDTKDRVLKFDSLFLANGINIIDDLLFWTDDKNPPRRLNTTINYLTDGFVEEDINVIVKPPLNAPTIVLSNSTNNNQENNIEDKFIQFSYRYKYENDEYSSMSPFSTTSFMPSDFSYSYGDAEFTSMNNKFNQVIITFNTGSERVKEIQLLFRDTLDNTVHVVEKFNKSNNSWGDNINKSELFNNSKIFSVLPPDEVTRLFDNVPLKAKAQDIIGSRLMYGNYVQFFDLVDSNSIKIIPDFSLDYTSSSSESFPLRTFRSNRDYEVGLAYLDDYGRMTTVITSPDNTVHIPFTSSTTGNNLQLTISSEAPRFASKYRVFVKQNRGVYYNIFPLYYYLDGYFRYFRINKSDVDKVKEGDYIVAKLDNVAVENSNKYKVIEVEVKERDFLGNDELSGLYFKIKVDSTTEYTGIDIFQNNYSGKSAPTKLDLLSPLTATYKKYLNNEVGIGLVEEPVFYGDSNTHNQINLVDFSAAIGGIPLGNHHLSTSIGNDIRFQILMDTSDTFTVNYLSSSGYVSHPDPALRLVAISSLPSTPVPRTIAISNPAFLTQQAAYIQFPFSSGYEPGDYWIVNCHSEFGKPVLGDFPAISYYNNPMVPGPDWAPSGSQVSYPQPGGSWTSDRPIAGGAVIRLKITENSPSDGISFDFSSAGSDQDWQEWVSPRRYVNIQEWFWESGAWRTFKHLDVDGDNIKAKNVFFRRGYNRQQINSDGIHDQITQENSTSTALAENPVYMIVKSASPSAFTLLDFSITQQESLNGFETDGKENVEDIFYETNLTLDITTDADGKKVHSGTQLNQVLGSNAAIVDLNNFTENANFNAYCFGNGIESMVVREDWNGRHLKYSPRASSTYEDYQQERVEEALTYSGVYRESSGINNLNEFNLSLANFKYLDKSFGSIQRIKSRDTDLVVFQEDKISKILYGKNLLSDSVGGGNIASIPQVLGTQVSFAGEYGISQNPESFAQWGNNMYFTDEYRGAVCRLAGNGIFEISSFGMSSWFRDLFIDESGKQKLGGYDPFKNKYVLAARDVNSSIVIDFEIIDKNPQGG